MMKTLLAGALVAAPMFADATAAEKYPVPLAVSEVKVQRVGEILFRYVEFLTDYPCIRFETLRPGDLKLIDRMEACTFKADGRSIDVRRKSLAGVGYKDYRLEGNTFRFIADIVVGGSGPGLPPLKCAIAIAASGKLSGPTCEPSTED